jgi:hypothetical protein
MLAECGPVAGRTMLERARPQLEHRCKLIRPSEPELVTYSAAVRRAVT